MKVQNGLWPPAAQVETFFAAAGTVGDGPVALLNLLKFRPRAAFFHLYSGKAVCLRYFVKQP